MTTTEAYLRLIDESVSALFEGSWDEPSEEAFDRRQRAIWDAIEAEGPDVAEAVRKALREREREGG